MAMLEVFSITLAFVLGLAVKQIGLPPLVGFLAAGFGLNWFGQRFGLLPAFTGDVLNHVAHLGVLLLLFTVGLKLKWRQLVRPEVLGGSVLHFAITVAVFAPGLHFFMGLDWNLALPVGIALAFSSTVLAAKMLEAKRELTAFHGRVAIGILIIQDLIALVVLSLGGGHEPSPWALLIFVVPLLRPILYWLINATGHDELLVLMGMMLALVLGGIGFESVGLSPELGALVMGMLLANHPQAGELSESLWGLKELFLVGFFLQIGMSGLPNLNDWIFALVMVLVLPLKGMLFYLILTRFRLRARNAFLAALSLSAYSEFGLIVAAGLPLLSDWLVPLALTVALSFTLTAPLNHMAHPLFERMERLLLRYQRDDVHPDEIPPDLSRTRIMIFGMGRTGTAAYSAIATKVGAITGIDADPYRVDEHRKAGRDVVLADAEDSEFWRSVRLDRLEVAVLAVDDLESKLIAARKLRERGFTGAIITHALFEENVDMIREAGADETYLTMQEAGISMAGHALEAIQERPPA
ncbi:MAG: cation:proton antiporter family protein [Wenzhouxiangella sp.]|jgi:predicted Kef-type K+ transport protein|nr:cation:proton antiporter family protein [Wenzhouxiangella sp.]